MDELLIEKVREHKLLYDLKSRDYMDQRMRQEAWEDIAQDLSITADKAKDTWNRLRRCFCNAIQRRIKKTGQGGKRIARWKFEHQMAFLLPFIENRFFVGRINDTFSATMLGYVGIITVSMCVEMYIISTQNSFIATFKGILYTTAGLFQYIICYCIPAQVVSDEADEVCNSVYFSEWYVHGTQSTKTMMLMMMRRSQKSVAIKAGGLININLDTCLKTIKTMISYCMFLRTISGTDRT